jgi:WD40 repeat protein
VRRFYTLIIFSILLLPIPVQSQDRIGFITALDWNVDGTKLAIGRDDGTLEILNTLSGDTVELANIGTVILSLDWNPVIESQLAAGIEGSVEVYDVESQDFLFYFGTRSEGGSYAAWSPDGTMLVTGDNDVIATNDSDMIRLWDNVGQLISDMYSHGNSITDVAWSPDVESHLFASTSVDDFTTVANAVSREIVSSYERTGTNTAIAWSPDGSQLAIVGYAQASQASSTFIGYLVIIDPLTGEVIDEPYIGSSMLDVAWSVDGTMLALIDHQARDIDGKHHEIFILDTSTWETVEIIDFEGLGSASALAWSSNGDFASDMSHENVEIIHPQISASDD